MAVKKPKTAAPTYTREEALADYRLAYQSRQASYIGRREVLSGKAKFGIFGDGKELANLAMARVFRKGDFRSGYYRDQTFMFAVGEHNISEFFAQLYAHTDVEHEPASGGRQMNAHFATRSLNPDGSWRNLMDIHNTSADLSPTGSQMPRLVGLAYASKLYRNLPALKDLTQFSHNGDEVAFGTIGNASAAEGLFWEAVNAIGVVQGPAVLAIWDDGYGISVPNEYQNTRDLSEMLSGFSREGGGRGYDLHRVRAWDYAALRETFEKAAQTARAEHVPQIIHVVEVTQPQGHSTSGSHERYKSPERLEWEKEFDCVAKFREWVVAQGYATADELAAQEKEDRARVEDLRREAWDAYKRPILQEVGELADILDEISASSVHKAELAQIKAHLNGLENPLRMHIFEAVRQAVVTLHDENHPGIRVLWEWKARQEALNRERISSHLHSQSSQSALNVAEVKAVYSDKSATVNGFEVMQACFDAILKRDPRVVAFGEDVGQIGDVNQGFAGLQEKYGELRVTDTGIRETTILGQAIGLALRGLRPICEIQYLDYLLYAIQILSDDLATLHWRTKGGQKAPVIVRTRGHRLEGIWHSGSLMGGLIHLARGVHVCVPRNMVQAAGMYNTLLLGDEPGIVVEVLNGYRLKEKLPDNIGAFTVPLGAPEVVREGSDITIVTYGPLVRIANDAADELGKVGIEVEIIDVQTLLPFDRQGRIVESLKKTNRVLFLDEDVPGGASAYMMQEVLERQGGYYWLDSAPRTLTGQAHRPAYGTDGGYFSKPSLEDIFYTVYEVMHEADPGSYPLALGR
jgi:pyruvate/2-oxoglutarate/acetoin dehydrogenase E1 component/TPP-dependent pyruvate/acetoin dehydrogenase alpha subunit